MKKSVTQLRFSWCIQLYIRKNFLFLIIYNTIQGKPPPWLLREQVSFPMFLLNKNTAEEKKKKRSSLFWSKHRKSLPYGMVKSPTWVELPKVNTPLHSVAGLGGEAVLSYLWQVCRAVLGASEAMFSNLAGTKSGPDPQSQVDAEGRKKMPGIQEPTLSWASGVPFLVFRDREIQICLRKHVYFYFEWNTAWSFFGYLVSNLQFLQLERGKSR